MTKTGDVVWLSCKQLADRFGVKLPTVYMWNYRKTGPKYFRHGNTVRFKLPDVEKWEDEHMTSV
jgi:excisionase family DNA binding protein